MNDDDRAKALLDAYLKEFDRLKAEQIQRIGHRDNLVYATLGVIGAALAFTFKSDGMPEALLVLPTACFILGWLHTMNDEKTSAIGGYFRDVLRPRIVELVGDSSEALLGWELAVRSAPRRKWRKVVQLGANALTFCAPGVIAAGAYSHRRWPLSTAELVGVAAQLLLLGVLGWEMIDQADLPGLGKSKSSLQSPAAEPAPTTTPPTSPSSAVGEVAAAPPIAASDPPSNGDRLAPA